eukprot:gene6164-2777_t
MLRTVLAGLEPEGNEMQISLSLEVVQKRKPALARADARLFAATTLPEKRAGKLVTRRRGGYPWGWICWLGDTWSADSSLSPPVVTLSPGLGWDITDRYNDIEISVCDDHGDSATQDADEEFAD